MIDVRRLSPQLAYIAAICEDACLGEGGKPGFYLDIESKSEEWLRRSVAQRLSGILHKEIKARRRTTRPYYRIRVWNKDLISALNNVRQDLTSVLSWSENARLAWVRGFIDAEGSVTLSGDNQPMLSIYNSVISKLKIIEEILRTYSIVARYYKPEDRDVWQQYFTGRSNLIKLLKTVKFEHPEKVSKLQSYLRNSG
jgi:hypothetical protein